MKDQFVPYELAVKLKELGFDGECLAYYNNGELWVSNKRSYKSFKLNSYLPDKNSSINNTPNIVYAPLWQQAFDWFRNVYRLDSFVRTIEGIGTSYWKISKLYEDGNIIGYSNFAKTYEEARHACLEQLIQLAS